MAVALAVVVVARISGVVEAVRNTAAALMAVPPEPTVRSDRTEVGTAPAAAALGEIGIRILVTVEDFMPVSFYTVDTVVGTIITTMATTTTTTVKNTICTLIVLSMDVN